MSANGKNLVGVGTFTTDTLTSKGTLTVDGASTLTGAVGIAGNVAVNTDKFTVAAASGNTLVAGTLAVTGASTLTGNATASGTLGVTGVATLTGGTVIGNAGDITANKTTTNANHIVGGADIAGTASFTTTGTTKAVTFGRAYANAPIVTVTSTDSTPVAHAVTSVDVNGFTVTRAAGGTSGAGFNYHVIGV